MNLRRGPGKEHDVMTVLKKGLLCRGLGDISEDGAWIRVEADELEGWVSSNHLA